MTQKSFLITLLLSGVMAFSAHAKAGIDSVDAPAAVVKAQPAAVVEAQPAAVVEAQPAAVVEEVASELELKDDGVAAVASSGSVTEGAADKKAEEGNAGSVSRISDVDSDVDSDADPEELLLQLQALSGEDLLAKKEAEQASSKFFAEEARLTQEKAAEDARLTQEKAAEEARLTQEKAAEEARLAKEQAAAKKAQLKALRKQVEEVKANIQASRLEKKESELKTSNLSAAAAAQKKADQAAAPKTLRPTTRSKFG